MTQNHQDDPILRHCRSLPGTTEDVKWGNNLVFSVIDKMYAVCDVVDPDGMSFKAEPMVFATLTEQEGIVPAPYLGRHGWVLVQGRQVLPEDVLIDLLSASHALVAAKLPKKTQRALGLLDD